MFTCYSSSDTTSIMKSGVVHRDHISGVDDKQPGTCMSVFINMLFIYKGNNIYIL